MLQSSSVLQFLNLLVHRSEDVKTGGHRGVFPVLLGKVLGAPGAQVSGDGVTGRSCCHSWLLCKRIRMKLDLKM